MYNPSNNVLFLSLLIAILLTVLVATIGSAPILVCAQTGVAKLGLLFGYVVEAATLIWIYKTCLVLEGIAYFTAGAAFGLRLWNEFSAWAASGLVTGALTK